MSHEIGGLWDDATEALKWRPILPLVAAARQELDPARKLNALLKVAEFAMRELNISTQKSIAFEVAAVVADLAENDRRVAALVERIIPRA
jgi:hypothetical protein